MLFFVAILFYCLACMHAVPLVKRIVVSPKITSPDASTVWNVGDKVLVTWDTSDIPEPKNFTGKLLLGFDSTDSENLDVDHPLATGFMLTDGQVQITVPNVVPKTNYIVVLFGDSGNTSPEFTITGGTESSSAPSATTSTVSAIPSSLTTPSSPTTSSIIATPSSGITSLTSAVSSASVSSASAASSVLPTTSTPLPTSTTPASSSASTSGTAGETSLPAQGSSNGALSRYDSGGCFPLLAAAVLTVTLFL